MLRNRIFLAITEAEILIKYVKNPTPLKDFNMVIRLSKKLVILNLLT